MYFPESENIAERFAALADQIATIDEIISQNHGAALPLHHFQLFTGLDEVQCAAILEAYAEVSILQAARLLQCDQDEWLAHRLLGSIYAREGNFKSATGIAAVWSPWT